MTRRLVNVLDRDPTIKMVDVPEGALGLPHFPDFAVLFNPTVEEINALAKAKPEMFIFSIVTKTEPYDMRKLVESSHVVNPYFIGHYPSSDHKVMIEQMIAQFARALIVPLSTEFGRPVLGVKR